jgi:uncharacterized repeat protein (TIGR02543 family)
VTFDADGGSCEQITATVTYGSAYGDLPVPVRTGYTFDGWYTAQSGGSKIEASPYVTTTEAHTLMPIGLAKPIQ